MSINTRPSIARVNKMFKDSTTINEVLNNLPELQYALCPFKLTLGITNTTEAGIKNIAYNPSNYTEMAKAFNGKGPPLLEWLNSTELKQVKNDIPYSTDPQTGERLENNFWETLFKVGTIFKGTLTNANIETIFTPSTYNEETVSLDITETINLTIRPPNNQGVGWAQNQQFLDDIVNNGFRFYNIPNIFDDTYLSDDPNTPDPKKSNRNIYKDSNKKFFYITGANAIYDKDTQKLAFMEVSFASVNNQIAKTGLADNQYLQKSAPGDSFAFPKWNETLQVVELDPTYLEPSPITHAQVGVYGNFAKTSIMMIGRPIRVIKDEKGNIIGKKIFSPRLIAPFKYQAPEYNNLYFTPIADANYFSVINCLPTLQEYAQTWKQNFQELYNIPAGKISNFDGVFATDEPNTLATNEPTSGANNKYTPFWDTTFGIDDNFYSDKPYLVEGSQLFYCLSPNETDFTKGTGLKTFNPKSIQQKNLANWNFFNFAIFKQFPQLPEGIKQITPIAFSSFPIIGGWLEKFTLGLGLGYKSVNNLSQPDAFPIPMLMPTETYIFGSSTMKIPLSGGTGVDGLIPFDLLNNGTIDSPENAVGVNKKLCSFAFNLTDKAIMRPSNVGVIYDEENPNTNEPTEGLLNDMNEYVIKSDGTQDKTKINMVDGAFSLVEPNKVGWEDYKVGFIIDKVYVLGGNKSKYDITFFSQTHDIDGNVDSDDSVWYGRYDAFSLKTNTIRSWANEVATSNPLWKLNIPPFPYPTNVRQVAPDNTNTYEQNIPLINPIQDSLLSASTPQEWTTPPTSYIETSGLVPQFSQTFNARDNFIIPTGYKVSNIEINGEILFSDLKADITVRLGTGGPTPNYYFENWKWLNGTYSKDFNLSFPFENSQGEKGFSAQDGTLFSQLEIQTPNRANKPLGFFSSGYDFLIKVSIVANKLQVEAIYKVPQIRINNGATPYGLDEFAGSTVNQNLEVKVETKINSFIVNFSKI